MKKSNFLYFITIFTSLIGCKTDTTLKIDHIDKEFNEQLLTGERLNDHLFSKKEKLQYYQLDNYKELQINELQNQLDSFVTQHYPIGSNIDFETLAIFFYKKDGFVNYADLVYEAAQDPVGSIEGYNQNLVAKIIFVNEKEAGKVIHRRIIYNKGEVIHTLSDTLSLK